MHALMPRIAQIAINTSFRMFPDSAAAKGEKDEKGRKASLSPEALALVDRHRFRGVERLSQRTLSQDAQAFTP